MRKITSRLFYILRYLWVNSPERVVKQLARVLKNEAREDIKEWSMGKHKQWNRLPYFLRMFEFLVAEAGHELKYKGRRVVEVGAGPALGFIPFMIVEGAEKAVIVEPGYSECRSDTEFLRNYLMPLYQTHSRIVCQERQITYEEFLKKILEVEIVEKRIEEITAQMGTYDIIISKSCLEYIQDIGTAVKNLAELSMQNAINIHYIDFTMHFPENRMISPFGNTYWKSRDDNPEYYKNPGGILNLLRSIDFVKEFRKHFTEVEFIPLIEYSRYINFDRIHAEWIDYKRVDLTTANGILIAVK